MRRNRPKKPSRENMTLKGNSLKSIRSMKRRLLSRKKSDKRKRLIEFVTSRMIAATRKKSAESDSKRRLPTQRMSTGMPHEATWLTPTSIMTLRLRDTP